MSKDKKTKEAYKCDICDSVNPDMHAAYPHDEWVCEHCHAINQSTTLCKRCQRKRGTGASMPTGQMRVGTTQPATGHRSSTCPHGLEGAFGLNCVKCGTGKVTHDKEGSEGECPTCGRKNFPWDEEGRCITCARNAVLGSPSNAAIPQSNLFRKDRKMVSDATDKHGDFASELEELLQRTQTVFKMDGGKLVDTDTRRFQVDGEPLQAAITRLIDDTSIGENEELRAATGECLKCREPLNFIAGTEKVCPNCGATNYRARNETTPESLQSPKDVTKSEPKIPSGLAVGMLRQWLNEERIKDGKLFVTNEDIHRWLDHKWPEVPQDSQEDYIGEIGTIPMGVSEWRNHGIKYGYWRYFKDLEEK